MRGLGLGLSLVRRTAASSSNTNLITAPEDFSNGIWSTGTTGTFTTNATTDPLGGSTADKFAEDTSTNFHYFRTMTDTVAQAKYFYSVHLKLNGTRNGRLYLTDLGSNEAMFDFDLSARTVGAAVVNSGTMADATAAVETPAAGWTRCIVGATFPAATTVYCFVRCLNAGSQNYLGDGASGVYAWGAKLEKAAASSAYP